MIHKGSQNVLSVLVLHTCLVVQAYKAFTKKCHAEHRETRAVFENNTTKFEPEVSVSNVGLIRFLEVLGSRRRQPVNTHVRNII